VDGLVHVSASAAELTDLTPGSFLDVTIDDVVDDFDFSATFRAVAERYGGAPSRRGRVLPVTFLPSVGSFGR
jgi:hypothetical protein